MAATRDLWPAVQRQCRLVRIASYQHVGSRATLSRRTRRIIRGPSSTAADFGGIPANVGTSIDLKLPGYDLVNLSAGLEFDSGLEFVLYANNLLDENAKLAFDRERGGRARLGFHVGQPRTIGITVRQKFGN